MRDISRMRRDNRRQNRIFNVLWWKRQFFVPHGQRFSSKSCLCSEGGTFHTPLDYIGVSVEGQLRHTPDGVGTVCLVGEKGWCRQHWRIMTGRRQFQCAWVKSASRWLFPWFSSDSVVFPQLWWVEWIDEYIYLISSAVVGG